MKKTIAILLMTISLGAFAQQTPLAPPASPVAPTPPTAPEAPRKEKVESMRIAFITQKLDLTPEEAQRFWPVYNEFQKKRNELRKGKRDGKGMRENIDSLSDKQVEALVDAEMMARQKTLELEKEYHAKFKSVLPIKKVAKLYRAEEQFTHRLLNEISERGKKGEARHGGRKGEPAPQARPSGPQGEN